jgi:SAM-dependent methyltransferase
MTHDVSLSPPPVAPPLERPSTWFTWHDHRFHPGVRVLDLAAGAGRHAIAAAALGAEVVALDADAERLEQGRAHAAARGVAVTWQQADLTGAWPALGVFDVVMVFNYLDRARMDDVRALVAPGGTLMMETFLVGQRHLGWGPQSDAHLLTPGELPRLVAPLDVAHGREVVEPVEGERWRAVAGVVAERRP